MHVEKSAHAWPTGAGDAVLHRVTVRASVSGPRVVVCANLHGDETVGTGAVLALVSLLPQVVKSGQVTLFPSLNPRGLVERTRTFGDKGQDLNRLFPGDATGTPSDRYAAWLWEQVMDSDPDALIDLHADSHDAVPYVIVDRPTGHRGTDKRAMAEAVGAMARSTGLVVLHDYAEPDYIRFGLDRSLAGACVNRAGVPAITVECGPRATLSPLDEARAAGAVVRVLAHLGLCLDSEPVVAPPATGPWRRRSGPRVRHEGVLRVYVRPGREYEHGTLLATVQALSGDVLEEVRAPRPGLLVAWANESWVRAGQAIATVASREDS